MRKLSSSVMILPALFAILVSSGSAWAISDLPSGEGLRAMSRPELQPFVRELPVGNEDGAFGPGGFDELLPFVMGSPGQQVAGSCLHMSITGIAEWWLARLFPNMSREPDGPLDLSERFTMNEAGYEEDAAHLPNWRIDAIYLFNRMGGRAVQNRSYRFTKGWYTGSFHDGTAIPASEGDAGAVYDTSFNWLDQRAQIQNGYVQLPRFERIIIHLDQARDQWAIGSAPPDIAERVKSHLRSNKAPVQVIYNHNGYWHSVYVIGFNDEIDNGNCAWTRDYRQVIGERAVEFQRNANAAGTPEEHDYWQVRADRAARSSEQIADLWAQRGGCSSSRGVFYVRDSIYPDADGPIYDYDPLSSGDESPYSRKIVLKEYDWLSYFANHVVQVFPVLPLPLSPPR